MLANVALSFILLVPEHLWITRGPDSALRTAALRWPLPSSLPPCLLWLTIPSPGSLTLLGFSYLSDLFFWFVFLLWRFFVLFLSLNVNIPQVLFPPFSFNKVFFEVSCIYGINYGLLAKGFPTPNFKYFCVIWDPICNSLSCCQWGYLLFHALYCMKWNLFSKTFRPLAGA